MRHVIVTRVSLSMAVVASVAALVFARFVTPRDDRPAMASEAPVLKASEPFASRCGACHVAGELKGALRNIPPERRRELERFLEDHGEATSEEDRLILDYLTRAEFQP